MSLHYEADPSPADWIVRAGAPWDQLVTFGPPHFPAYARLRFIPDPDGPHQSEADVGSTLPADHPSEIDQAERALAVLSRFTGTVDRCWFCLWDGYGDLALPNRTGGGSMPDLPPRPTVVVPQEYQHRRYFLLSGPLAALAEWTQVADSSGMPPAFIWPADHAWVWARDVDPHWAGIGAQPEAVAALIATPGLDVVRTRPDAPHPFFRGS